MLGRPEGATVAQIAEATDWNSITVRGFLAGLKKNGHGVEATQRIRQVGPNKAGGRGPSRSTPWPVDALRGALTWPLSRGAVAGQPFSTDSRAGVSNSRSDCAHLAQQGAEFVPQSLSMPRNIVSGPG